MSKIIIKKKVNLDFLGDEYKDAVLVFRSIPITDFEQVMSEMPDTDPHYSELVRKVDVGEELTEKENAELIKLRKANAESNKESIRLITGYLKRYFVSGKFPDAATGELVDVTDPEDLDGLDQETAIKCFNVFTGQDDPKDNPSQMPSPTAVSA